VGSKLQFGHVAKATLKYSVNAKSVSTETVSHLVSVLDSR
jgi:hypothetical protein